MPWEWDHEDLAATTGLRLNVGSGSWPLAYWTNLDADPEAKDVDVCAVVPPIPYDDESLLEVWAGHFLEHLSRDEAQVFLEEAYRVLMPKGKLGILVPDTREIMRRYLAGSIDAVEYPYATWWDVNDLDAVCHLFLYSTVQDSPHRWGWDQHTLARAMTLAGFKDLAPIDRYRDPRIVQGAWYQFGLFGTKPAIEEMTDDGN